MQRLEVSLFLALDRSEPHCRPGGRFGDSLGIDNVALVRLHVWLHELRRDQANLVPQRLRSPGNPL